MGFSGGEDTDGTSFFTSTAGAVSAGTAGTATGGVAMAGGSEAFGTSGLATSLGGSPSNCLAHGSVITFFSKAKAWTTPEMTSCGGSTCEAEGPNLRCEVLFQKHQETHR